MAKKFTGSAASEFKVRVPEEVRTAIETAARFNNRTLNAEINERLTRSISGLAEEVLLLAYGEPAPGLIEAYRRGMLRLRDEDIKHIKKCLNQWVDQFKTAMEG
jgi:hypothetical protein